MSRRTLLAPVVVVALLLAGASTPLAMDFPNALARIDAALVQNPTHANELALRLCRDRRNAAVRLYDKRQTARAERSLKFCFNVLGLSEAAPVARDVQAIPNMEAITAQAARELERALELTRKSRTASRSTAAARPAPSPRAGDSAAAWFRSWRDSIATSSSSSLRTSAREGATLG